MKKNKYQYIINALQLFEYVLNAEIVSETIVQGWAYILTICFVCLSY